MTKDKWYYLVVCIDVGRPGQQYDGMIDEVRFHHEIGDAPGIHHVYMEQRKARLEVSGG